MKRAFFILVAASFGLGACMPAELVGENPAGKEIRISFYPGGTVLDDLMIIDGVNHFGKAQYQMDDPIADVGFRTNDGARVQAECISVRKDILDQDECARYEVYRSNFAPVPEGSTFDRPAIF